VSGARRRWLAAAITAVALLAARGALAHRALAAKFDETKSQTLAGIVTLVDWRNPQAHVFINVGRGKDQLNWAIELESPVLLEKSGWHHDTLKPGDAVTVTGPTARDGTRQIWAESLVQTSTSKRVLYAVDTTPIPPESPRPTPRGKDGKPLLGAWNGEGGYWGYPTSTVLMQQGANVAMDGDGLLKNLADAARVAPFQPWALALYQHRQRRHLADDPGFINCKAPGGVRHFQSPYGVELVQDPERQRVFVIMGSGNRNYRIIYLDGRDPKGQVRGDDDNPLYYGRSVGHWDGDTLVVNTTGFNEDFWFTNGGLPHTDKLAITERFSRPNLDTLRYDVTIDDPGAYTKSWSSGWELRWVGGEELPFFLCQDNRS
jgi:hypothetical protein